MKILKPIACLAITALCATSAGAQEKNLFNQPDTKKPALFADVPERQVLQVSSFESIVNLPEGAEVSTELAPGLPVIGRVVSKSNPADNTVRSVVIASHTRPGATFTLSRIVLEDGSVKFTGRLLSKGHIDALEISREGSQYIISKKSFYDLVSE